MELMITEILESTVLIKDTNLSAGRKLILSK